jgi:hypothetical protein
MLQILIGLILILTGCIIWYNQERRHILKDSTIIISIVMIAIGASLFIYNIQQILVKLKINGKIYQEENSLYNWIFILGLIYLGTVCYTIASYYHLRLERWTLLHALLIAIPFVLIEYQFSLRGNYYAKKHLFLNAIQITLITMIFYFINSWLLNYFILKSDVIWWRELLSFLLIFSAFLVTTNRPNK